MFKYGTVYDTIDKKLVPMREIPADVEIDQKHLGPLFKVENLELYAKGLMQRFEQEEIKHERKPYEFPIDRIKKDMDLNNINFSTFEYLTEYYEFTKVKYLNERTTSVKKIIR